MVTLPFALIYSSILSPTLLEVVIVMTPWAGRVVEVRSVPRRTKSQMRSCLLIAWLEIRS